MDVIQYKCPNCGGDIKFDPASGNYSCEYCKSSFTQAELDRQTNAKVEQAGGSAAPASSADKAADTAIDDARVYICPSCGATIVTDSTTAATFCYYCHNPIVLSGRLDGACKPDYVVPFRIDRRKAESIFEEWISRKKYVPKYFYSREQIEKLTGVYFPYFVYSCDVSCKLEAQGTKTKVYTEGDREYTDTGMYHVRREGSLGVKHALRNALNKANKVLSDSVLPFDTDELRPFNMSYLSGFFAEKRDIERAEVEPGMIQEVTDHAVSALNASLAGYSDITAGPGNITLSNGKWWYALLPVWTLTYNDNGKIYYFSINGQTGRTVGELPVDRDRLIRVFLLIFLPFAAVLLLFFYFVL